MHQRPCATEDVANKQKQQHKVETNQTTPRTLYRQQDLHSSTTLAGHTNRNKMKAVWTSQQLVTLRGGARALASRNCRITSARFAHLADLLEHVLLAV